MTNANDAIAKSKRRWELAELALEIASLAGGALVIWGLYAEGLRVLGSELVIIGVAIEVAFGWCVLVTSRKLQSILESEFETLRFETAQANARAAEAVLELAKFKAPRSLTKEQQERIADKLRVFTGMPFSFVILPAPEPQELMEKIASALESAGWVRVKWNVKNATIEFRPVADKPASGMTFSLIGIRIELAEEKYAEWGDAMEALRQALSAEGMRNTGLRARTGTAEPDGIHVMIGQKE